eukprot:Pgem_evm1s10767
MGKRFYIQNRSTSSFLEIKSCKQLNGLEYQVVAPERKSGSINQIWELIPEELEVGFYTIKHVDT